jgi:anhydro-N-acetylmuramic acid kinase
MSNRANIYIGLMSGTSMDSIDAVAVIFRKTKLELVACHSIDIPEQVGQSIRRLCHSGEDNIDLYARTDQVLGRLFSQAVNELVASAKISTSQIVAVGSHGQTIRHQPPGDMPGYSLQIGDPNTIATETGCTVVADFRRADMALGGQGAPLVPAFHQCFFAHPERARVILNIGGIANLTLLHKDHCSGFDTGPGNLLLDAWCLENTGAAFDNRGAWSKTGVSNRTLVDQLKQQAFFRQSPPKSTGREQFNLDWLKQQLNNVDLSAADIQASLTSFTAETVSEAIALADLPVNDILVCGGGAYNDELIAQLDSCLTIINLPKTTSTATLGLDPRWVEACAFAWLAKQRLERSPGNITAVTGASRVTVLGGVFQP